MDNETITVLREQAEALGVAVDGRWSEDTLLQKIEAAMAPSAAEPEAQGEKPLHVLNAEARKAYASDYGDRMAASRSGRRVQKNLRAPV